MLVDIDVFAAGHIEFSVLVRQDCHLVRVIPLHHLATFTLFRRNTIFNIVLKLVVASFELALIARLVTDLNRKSLLLAVLGRKVLRALRDAALCHLIQDL